MATDGAVSVEGGDFQIFEEFLNRSGAKVHLGTKVCRVRTSRISDLPMRRSMIR